jgi:hypothetical protein
MSVRLNEKKLLEIIDELIYNSRPDTVFSHSGLFIRNIIMWPLLNLRPYMFESNVFPVMCAKPYLEMVPLRVEISQPDESIRVLTETSNS